MRTTLKRGIGQSVDGNGDGNREFLPEALSGMRRYRQPPSGRTALGLTGQILLLILAVVVMLAAALAGGAWLFFDQSVQAVQAHSPAVKDAQKLLDAVGPANKPTTALILGYDKRFKEGDNGRSDTIMLVRADPVTNSLSLLSFPRDLEVPIYCPGKAVWVDKINAAYAYCNVKGSVDTLKHLTGLSINYLITVNFRGFRQVVDRLGGVWIDVDHRYYNRNVHTLDTNYANINLRAGYQRLNGQQALAYARYRHTDSDFHRIARQQAFVKALKERAANSFSPLDLPGLINSIVHNVEVGRGGGGEISRTAILQYALFAYRLQSGHFFQPKIENVTGSAQLHASPASIQAAVSQFVHPDIRSPQEAEAAILGRKKTKLPKVRPRAITVSVLNGNKVQGSAASARGQLKDRGFRTVEPVNPLAANAPNQNYWHTTIYYDADKKLAQAGAERLQAVIGDAKVVRGIPSTLKPLSLNAMTIVVVGKTFHNLAPAPIQHKVKKEPAVIRLDPLATRGLLRKAQRKVPFRLEVPRIVERYSEPDTPVSWAPSSMPIRVYSMAKHDAVRLVFRMQNTVDYWGIEETDWTDAPVLQKPNATRFVKGRRFDLYFSGQHLHQIVLRENDASYWVENSLLNSLSNETMLAIAKGLRPLKKHG